MHRSSPRHHDPSRESDGPSPEQTRATSVQHRSRSAASCRAVRCSLRHASPQSATSAPAPSRTWGKCRDDPAALPGASGRCRWRSPSASGPSSPRARWQRALTGMFSGSARCRRKTSVRRVRRGWPSLRPPSFRRWGLWSWLSRSLPPCVPHHLRHFQYCQGDGSDREEQETVGERHG